MIGLAPYAPDKPALEGGTQVATNVYPSALRGDGGVIYKPFLALNIITNALTARCQGAFAAGGKNFAGDATDLYELTSATWTSTDTGFTTATDGRWAFTQFGDNVIATNGVDAVQTWVLGTSTSFAALGGTPPVAKYAATVRDFLVLGNTGNYANGVDWSGINNPATWTPSQTTLADGQQFPDGGDVTGIVGGEYGVIIQTGAIRRMTFVGIPAIFQFDKVDDQVGCRVPGSIAAVSPRMVFFLGDDGFYVTDGNGPAQPIGDQLVDETVKAEINEAYLHRVTAIIDPSRRLYICAIPTTNSADGTPDKFYIYNYQIRQWSVVSQSVEILWVNQSSSYTLEQLDSILGYTNVDTMPFSLDSAIFVGGVPTIAAFSTAHKSGYFNGDALEATVETFEAQPIPNRRARVVEVFPYVDGSSVTPTVSIGARESQQSSVAYSTASAVNGSGFAPVRASGRYLRARIVVPAGSDWTSVQGVDIDAHPDGKR